MRISRLLSKGCNATAKKLSKVTLIMAAVSSLFCAIILFFTRHLVANAMANDDILEGILLEIIPYLIVCQPLACICTTASDLNRALGMYVKSTKIDLLMTLLVTIPTAYLVTVHFDYNIDGLTASAFVGEGAIGILTLATFLNADWEKAVLKNRIMGGLFECGGCTSDQQLQLVE